MPKILIAQCQLDKRKRFAATSLPNMKALLKKKVKKNEEATDYLIVTLMTSRLTLPVVVALINSSFKKLKKSEDCTGCVHASIDPARNNRMKVTEA